RRRHTRFARDWSSDVCSSDLQCFFQLVEISVGGGACLTAFLLGRLLYVLYTVFGVGVRAQELRRGAGLLRILLHFHEKPRCSVRSEERRGDRVETCRGARRD